MTAPTRRCAYCGRRPCECGADLARIEQAMRGDTHPGGTKFRAVCPKCGEIAKPGRKRCALCRTELYPADGFLAALGAGKYSGTTKGTAT